MTLFALAAWEAKRADKKKEAGSNERVAKKIDLVGDHMRKDVRTSIKGMLYSLPFFVDLIQ